MPRKGDTPPNSVPWLDNPLPFVPSALFITGMPTKHVKCVQQVFLLVTTCILLLAVPAAGLCDQRCEKANPSLHRLKSIWSRAYSDETVDFDEFIQYLISASGDNQRLSPLRATLVRMIGRYRDCVMACEHAFSKRSNAQTDQINRKDQLCKLLFQGELHSNTPIPVELMTYCVTRAP